MKQKIWKIRFILVWALLGMGIFRSRANAASVQEKNMVVVFALDERERSMGCCNGFAVSQSDGNAIVIAMSDETWDKAAGYSIEGPGIESQRVWLDSNNLQSGVAVFTTRLTEEGFPHTATIDFAELFQNQIVYQGGMDLEMEADSLSERVFLDQTTIVEAGEIDGYTYVQMADDFRTSFIGGPVFVEDGRLAGIMVEKNQEEGLFLPIEYVLDGLPSGDGAYVIANTPFDIFFLSLIPVFGILFLVSLILYISKENRRKAVGGEEFSNVLVFGGEDGLQLRGKSGYFKDVDFPLTEDIVFGRDPFKASVVYPEETSEISRQHCRIQVSQRRILLIDLSSTYGTFLRDGTKLEPNVPYELKFGDEFYLVEPSNMFRIV